MRTSRFALQLALLLSLPITALADAVTFDFSGNVTLASGIYSSVPVGATVSGTYTFDLSNANPSQSSGTAGSPSASWTSSIFGGSFYLSAPTPVDSVVFSSTASVDGFTYASSPPAPYATFSRVLTAGPPMSSFYEADDLVCTDASSCHSSDLFGSDLFGINYTSAGLPDFSASPAAWSGEFATGEMGTSPDYLDFDIVSLTPAAVPEPASLTLLPLGVIVLALARRRRGRQLWDTPTPTPTA
jgi:hypothetical protein